MSGTRVQEHLIAAQDALDRDVTIPTDVQRLVRITVMSIRSAIKGLTKCELVQIHQTWCIEDNAQHYQELASRVSTLEQQVQDQRRELASFFSRHTPSLAARQHGSLEDLPDLRGSAASLGGDEEDEGLFITPGASGHGPTLGCLMEGAASGASQSHVGRGASSSLGKVAGTHDWKKRRLKSSSSSSTS
ncbi:MAG: hypothetical protein LQ352_006169 [Teloschistes flavicans]|nr:MAG: hypothetical protein LQ352_006169 [Teloschistes flavicans]